MKVVQLFFLFFCLPLAVSGQETAMISGSSQQSGRYQVTLWLPVDGLFAGEEQQLEFRIFDTSRVDPVLGPAAVIRAEILATLTMPLMPSMPRISEQGHPEGPPGAYGLHPTFAHGGDYSLALRITPPRGEPFSVQFPLKVADNPPIRQPHPKPYKIEIATAPSKLKAGQQVSLQFKVWANRELRDAAGIPTGKRIWEQAKTFEQMHEKTMHLILVRKDLNIFFHLHPEKLNDGSFKLANIVFPSSGDYQLFAEVAPLGAGAQILLGNLKVEGKHSTTVKPGEISRDEFVINGVKVSLADRLGAVNNQWPAARKTLPLIVTLQDSTTGEPAADLQTYLGAQGHLIGIHDDAVTFVHAHPDERESSKPGRIVFLARWPKPGTYRVWIEFQRAGKVQTAEFVVLVKE